MALRLGSRPYLDQFVWEKILRKTDWITCVRLNHTSIAKELLPSTKETQKHLHVAIANGNIRLVRGTLNTISGFPDLDIAAETDQFEMLQFLDGLDRAGSAICLATEKMGFYAAANNNQEMLEWLLENRLEVDGKGMLEGAAGTGNMALIHWVLEQADRCSISYIDPNQRRDSIHKALAAGYGDIAAFLADRFNYQSVLCTAACKVASLAVIQQILPAHSKHLTSKDLAQILAVALRRSDIHIFSAVLTFLSGTQSWHFPVQPRHRLLDTAAGHGSLSIIELLYAHLPDDLKDSYVTDQAMQQQQKAIIHKW